MDRMSIDERYISAGNTSNLTVIADRGGAGDVLIAVGWCRSRIGSALMRLHSEYDGAAKRSRMSDTDLMLLRMQLKSLTSVLAQVVRYMQDQGMHGAEQKAGPIVGYWLNKTCGSCHGLRFETLPGTPTLSKMRCRSCRGDGTVAMPYPKVARQVLTWIDDCIHNARNSAKRHLRR